MYIWLDLSKLILKRFFPVHANILINKYITTVSIHLQYFVYINAFLFFFSYNSRFTIHVPGKGLFLSIYIYIYIYIKKKYFHGSDYPLEKILHLFNPATKHNQLTLVIELFHITAPVISLETKRKRKRRERGGPGREEGWKRRKRKKRRVRENHFPARPQDIIVTHPGGRIASNFSLATALPLPSSLSLPRPLLTEIDNKWQRYSGI